MAKLEKGNPKLIVAIIFIAYCIYYLSVSHKWVIFDNQTSDSNMTYSDNIEWGIETSSASYTLFRSGNDKALWQSITLLESNQVPGYKTVFLSNGTRERVIIGGGNKWGYGGTPLGGNDEEGDLPDSIHLAYFDELANIYFISDHSLPKDTISKLMTDTHRRMAGREDEIPNYYKIELGFTPKGWVIVYVTGWAGRKEVASFQAQTIEPDPLLMQVPIVSSSDEYSAIEYKQYLKAKEEGETYYQKQFKLNNPEGYKKWQSGEWSLSSDWYKKTQTKYPWNLSVVIDGHEWNGEYYAEFANTEKYAVLDDQFDTYHKSLKAVPHKIKTWVTDSQTNQRTELEVHLYPRPKWAAMAFRKASYQPYYQDPNLERFMSHFKTLYPTRSLSTNNQAANLDDFATLRLHFNSDLVLQDSYLIKGDESITLDGVYQFSKTPVDTEKGPYDAKKGYPIFITEPNLEDLSDPAFVDID